MSTEQTMAEMEREILEAQSANIEDPTEDLTSTERNLAEKKKDKHQQTGLTVRIGSKGRLNVQMTYTEDASDLVSEIIGLVMGKVFAERFLPVPTTESPS